jgi:carbon storage regulator
MSHTWRPFTGKGHRHNGLEFQGGLAMLVLTRKKEQSVHIGTEIEVTVLEIRGDRVKLGFRCPPEVAVHRQEIFERITQFDAREAELIPARSTPATV